MQRWFRFSGAIALVGLLSSGIPLPTSAHAEEKPAAAPSPQESPASADASAEADTTLEGFDPHDLPTPGKHQLRPTPLQIANHRIKRLNERLVTQNNRVAHLESILTKQQETVTAQETTIKELQESLVKADARLQAMFDQIATVSRQVEGLESRQVNQADHATRSARVAQQAMRASQQQPGGPNVQTARANEAPIPRAQPVEQSAPTPAPTPEKVVEPPPEGSIVYEVKPGDNLTRIARAHRTTVAEIMKFNKITDERKLQIGQELNIPPGDAPEATPQAAPAPSAPAQP